METLRKLFETPAVVEILKVLIKQKFNAKTPKERNTERLISCVMENMADEAIRILRSGFFNKKVLKDVGGCEARVPLSMITRCYYILLDDVSSWNESFQHIVIQQKSECKKLMDFWFTEYGCPVYEEIDFAPYENDCNHFDKYWGLEDLLDADIDTLETLGYTKDESEFCYAVLTYRYDLIQKHLQLGTLADIDISDHPRGFAVEGETYNALRECNTFYCDAFDIYGLSHYLKEGYAKRITQVDERDFKLLLQAAAYCQLEGWIKSRSHISFSRD